MSVINGTPGADALNGTALGDQINGGAGDDVLRGLGGADTLNGGAGADRFVWNAGDGSDQVEGGVDADTGFFTGGNFRLSASAGHALVTSLGETVDLHGVETLNLHGATTGASFTVGDLSATDVRQVVIGLDAGANAVALTGAATADILEVQVLSGGTLRVFDTVGGVLQTIAASKLDSADQVTVDGGAGNDTITLETPAGVVSPVAISAHGGVGDDTLTGSTGADRLYGDAGDDVIKAGGGADTIDGGAGANTIDGGTGADVLQIGGGAGISTVVVSASNGHLRATVGGATSDVVNVEALDIRSLGRGEAITVGDISNTSVRAVNIDLSGTRGGDNGSADTVTLHTGPTNADSAVSFAMAADGSRLQATSVANGATVETFTVASLGAGDLVNLVGGDGNDTFSGASVGGALHQIDGGLGFDILTFNATTGNDAISLTGPGDHLQLTLNGAAPLDLIGIDAVRVEAGPGADTIQVNDMHGKMTGVLNVNLGGPGRTADGQADTATFVISPVAGATLQGWSIPVGLLDNPAPMQEIYVRNPDGGVGDDVVVSGLDAQDRIIVNLLGDGVSPWHGSFANSEFRLSSGDNTINWALGLDTSGHTSINGGAGSDTVFVGALSNYGPDHDPWSIGLTASGATSVLSVHHSTIRDDPNLVFKINLGLELTNVERVSVTGGQASDVIVIGDQSGTSVKQVDIEVSIDGDVQERLNGPDGVQDLVFLDGTSGADTISIAQTTDNLVVRGLPAAVKIHDLDDSDQIFIRSGAGDDLIDLTLRKVARGMVHVDSGSGNDTMFGGIGAESFEFHGGAGGHDVVVGFRAHAMGGAADVVSIFSSPDHSFNDLAAHRHIFQSGDNVVITDGAGAFLTLNHVNLASLTASDFVF